MHEEALHLVIIWCVLHTGGVIRSFLFLAMSVTPLLSMELGIAQS